MVGGFQFAVGLVCGVRLVMESAIGQGSAKPFVEEQEQESDLNPLGGEPVRVASAVALEEAMAFELTQIIAELVESVSGRGKLKAGEHGLVDLFGG